MRRYDGRVTFVTGAAHGIGRAVAERLSGEGGTVAVADVDQAATQRAVEELGERAFGVHCDVTSQQSVEAAVAATAERCGRLDVLVNNAGGAVRGEEFEAATTADWHRQLDLTLVGAAHCVRAALPHLLSSGGNVVSIGSVNGLAAFGTELYSAAKAGLQNLTLNLAARYAPQGVRFNLVAPGTIRTRVWDDQPGALDRIRDMIPMGRPGEPHEIAAAVAYLGSDDASFVTGVLLRVDGGVLVGPAGSY